MTKTFLKAVCFAVLAAAAGASEHSCAAGGSGCPALGDASSESVLLQWRNRRHKTSKPPATDGDELWDRPLPVDECPPPKKLSDVGGKSIYLVLVDRFARDNGNETACDNDDNAWCGGTLKGITQQLDYIQGMGFDCVWITPVVKQFEGKDGASGYSSHGYWAKDWYEIDEHFGTKDDLKELSAELHKRDMCFVYDFVTNHVMPLHSAKDIKTVHPFNKVEYYHTMKIDELANCDFDSYVAPALNGNWPPPVQALRSGAQCADNKSCSCFKCPYDTVFGEPCNVTMAFDENSPCPKDAIYPACMPGDYACKGYNEKVTHDGWFYSLGDLNHENEFVRDELLRWGRHMVDTYDIDVVRLDTAAYQPLGFLSNLQDSVCVPVIGEVTATNMTFHAQIESHPVPPAGKRGLAGVLNFPLTYAAGPGFCGNRYWPFADSNLTWLGERMTEQMTGGLYRDLDTLGNQIDNHDMARLADICHGDMSKIMNHIAWNMLAKGAPTIYYGTEVGEKSQRNSLWQYGWKQDTPLYMWLAVLNHVRKEHELYTTESKVKMADANRLVFTRGHAWVFLNNFGEGTDSVKYCDMELPHASPGRVWVDALDNNKPAKFDHDGCFVSRSSVSSVLVEEVEPCPVKKAYAYMKALKE